MRFVWTAIFLFGMFVAGACSHGPVDPASRARPTLEPRPELVRQRHPPYGSLVIAKVTDERPGHEYGQTNYLRYSYVSNRLYDRPLPAMLTRLLARDFQESGVFTVTEDAEHADYLIDVAIRHLFARYETSVLAITLIVPSISVESTIELAVKIYDKDGRRFVDKVYVNRDDAVAPAVAGATGTAQSLLEDGLADLMRELVHDADLGVETFWKDLNLPIPAPGAEH